MERRSQGWILSIVGVSALACGMLSALIVPAQAEGFHWFFRHVHPSGKCGSAREVAVSYYWTGRLTASGEKFNPHAMTAAHRTLPFGTRVRLTYPKNGQSVTVKVNDRGPYGAAHALGVKFDLARGAARALGMVQTEWLCVEMLGR